ncbi:hypothetical protein [Flavobacterium sp.]|uniref:hypothetical protein n=1 Tax=Flavobacterium sp. TaxID=239 RepID=UPI0035B357FF
MKRTHIIAYLFIFSLPYCYIWSQNTALSRAGGKISLDKATIGLNNVDNTADSNKPISTATLNALNAKQISTNKTTDINLDNNFPTVKTVKDYIDGINTSSNANWWKTAGNSGGSSKLIGTTDAQDLVFKTNNLERMRITKNGNIGIGTTTPATDVHIVGNLKMIDGNQAEGKILTGVYDVNGYANWINILNILKYSFIGYYAFDPNTVVSPIVSGTGRVWMDRNLGALQRPQTPDDYLSFGQLFQWGRSNDGHADIKWSYNTQTGLVSGALINGLSNTITDSPTPTNSKFIMPTSGSQWRITLDNNLWNGVNAINNPCPRGYRVPTTAEFQAEISYYGITNKDDAFSNNPLRFTAPSKLNGLTGIINFDYNFNYYWTSTPSSGGSIYNSELVSFEQTSVELYDGVHVDGCAIRCIKD